MELLKLIEGIRTPFLDTVFGALTHLGGETVFMAVAIVLFWCVSKKNGYFILMTGFLGTVLNQFLKLSFRIPRPWVLDESFTIVESARAEATGYSFPSGHTQNITGTFGGLARAYKNKALRIGSVAIVLLVAFSRMYLGVHTPLDVGVSLVIGTVLVLLLYPAFEKWYDSPKAMNSVLIAMAAIAIAYTLYVELKVWPADIDPHNLASGIKNGYTLSGASLGMLLCYNLDKKYLNFRTEAPIGAQIVKCVVGLGLVVAIKALAKGPLAALFGGHQLATAVRYFLIVFFAAYIWPLCFPYITSLFEKKRNK